MDDTTLIIRHMPAELTAGEQEDFLRHFGASKARCMGTKGKMRHTAFASFSSPDQASDALSRLHQLTVLGSKLVVQYSHKTFAHHHPGDTPVKPTKDSTEEGHNKKAAKDVIELDPKQATDNVNELSSKWGLEYPMNPRLQYMYPAPTVTTLTNIANALATVPRFYVQVLHLMNKMNLPAPFNIATPTPPLQEDAPSVENTQQSHLSSEESELESDGEGKVAVAHVNKRKAKDSIKPHKKLKLQKIICAPKSSVAPVHNPKDVFEQPVEVGVKKLELKINQVATKELLQAEQYPHFPHGNDPPISALSSAPQNLLTRHDNEEYVARVTNDSSTTEMPPESETPGGFGKIQPQTKSSDDNNEDNNEESPLVSEFISSRELEKGRISPHTMKQTSVFKRYDAGEATTRLYIKNLHKQVGEKDLHYIYGRYINWNSDLHKNMFDVRLMKEGRMKGQAFVTLPDEVISQKALKDTNGYMLHNKPIVVQFARSAKPKEDNK